MTAFDARRLLASSAAECMTAVLWRRGSGLSLGDRLGLALGVRLGRDVLTADAAWEGLPGVVLLR